MIWKNHSNVEIAFHIAVKTWFAHSKTFPSQPFRCGSAAFWIHAFVLVGFDMSSLSSGTWGMRHVDWILISDSPFFQEAFIVSCDYQSESVFTVRNIANTSWLSPINPQLKKAHSKVYLRLKVHLLSHPFRNSCIRLFLLLIVFWLVCQFPSNILIQIMTSGIEKFR